MALSIDKDNDQLKLRFEGDLTIYQSQDIKDAIDTESLQLKHLVIDLEAVTSLDTAGIQLLLCMARTRRLSELTPPDLVHGPQSRVVFQLFSLENHFSWGFDQAESMVGGVGHESRTSH